VAGFTGMGGRFQTEWVAGFHRNRWPVWTGILRQNYLTSVKADGQQSTIEIETAPLEVKIFEAWFMARTIALAEVKDVQLDESGQYVLWYMTKIGHQMFPDFKELSLQEQLDEGHKCLKALIEESSGKFPRNPTRPFTRH